MFFGWLDLKQFEIRGSARKSRVQSSANNMHGNCFFFLGGGGGGGGNLWSRNGLVFFGSLRSSVGVLPDFHPHSIIPVT